MVKWGSSFAEQQDKAKFEKQVRSALHGETWRWLGSQAEQPPSPAAFQRPSSATTSKSRSTLRLRYPPPRVMPSLPQELPKRSFDARFVRALYDAEEDEVIAARKRADDERSAYELRQRNARLDLEMRVASFQLSKLRRSWRGWKRQRRAWERRKEAVQRMQARVCHREQVDRWRAWARRTAQAQRIHCATGETHAYMFLRNLARGWRRWYRLVERAVRRRNAMRRTIVHMMNRKLSLGWNVWAQMVASVLKAKQDMRRVLGFLFNSGLKRGWLQWHHSHFEAVRKLELMRHVARLLASRDRARGWHGWHGTWLELNAAKDLMRKSLSRMIKRGLSRGWEAWMDLLDVLKQRAADRETWMNSLKSRTHLKLSKGWFGWRNSYAEAMNKLGIMRAALVRFRSQELTRCWEVWKEKALAVPDAIDEALRYTIHQQMVLKLYSKKVGSSRLAQLERDAVLARKLAGKRNGKRGLEDSQLFEAWQPIPPPRHGQEFHAFLEKSAAEAGRLRARRDAALQTDDQSHASCIPAPAPWVPVK